MPKSTTVSISTRSFRRMVPYHNNKHGSSVVAEQVPKKRRIEIDFDHHADFRQSSSNKNNVSNSGLHLQGKSLRSDPLTSRRHRLECILAATIVAMQTNTMIVNILMELTASGKDVGAIAPLMILHTQRMQMLLVSNATALKEAEVYHEAHVRSSDSKNKKDNTKDFDDDISEITDNCSNYDAAYKDQDQPEDLLQTYPLL